MPYATTFLLAPHFTAGELRADHPSASEGILRNLTRTAAMLESLRAVLGVPLRVTSGFRPSTYNASVGGSPSSNHLDGLAADFIPIGLTQHNAYLALTAAATARHLPPFDQIIYYPVQGHIHVGIGPRMRGEVRIYLSESAGTDYPFLAGDLVQRLGGFVAGAVAGAVASASTALGKTPKPPDALLLVLVAGAVLFVLVANSRG